MTFFKRDGKLVVLHFCKGGAPSQTVITMVLSPHVTSAKRGQHINELTIGWSLERVQPAM